MFRVFACLTDEHDLRLVALAGVVCLLASLVAISLFHRARATRGHARHAWLALAGLTAGCGIWATHFVAMLAYEPGVAVAFDIGLTGLSLVAASLVTFAGLTLAVSSPARWAPPVGGGIVGAGVAAMHYIGMAAMELPGHMTWMPGLVALSLVFGLVFGAAALAIAMRRDDMRGTLAAAVLLTIAIVSHHFTAMGAVEIVPDLAQTITPASLSAPMLALAVAAAAVAILSVTLIGALADRILDTRKRQFARAHHQLIQASEEKLREQHLLLDTAINNMSQGLVMFDKDLRLAVCNQRYLEMYGMPPELLEQRPTLREVLAGHFSRHMFAGNPDDYVDSIMRDVANDTAVARTVTTADGRVISIINRQLSDGGRIATHEDITERHRLAQANAQAEARIHEQKLQLDAALNNMTQGVCMFDAGTRIVVCNRRFLEMYRLSPNVVQPGCTFLDLVRHRKAVGLLDVDPEEYCRNILDDLARGGTSSMLVQATDGRMIRALSHPMPDGGWVTTHEDITEQRRAEEQLREQKLQLDTALDNMSQGLCLFDAQTRLILCNQRYLEMYDLPPDMVKPGMMLVELLTLRRAKGTFSRDPQDYVAELQTTLAGGKTFDIVTSLSDGRIVTVGNHPMPTGGWVSTHDDITEQRQAEELLREQKLQLDSALNNMTQGLNMFDALGRLVVCNERYREMYRLPAEAVRPGVTVAELVAARIAAGTFFDTDGDQYAAELVAAMSNRAPTSATMELTDGRVIAVISQPTASDGGWVVTHEDITERHRLLEAQAQAEQQLSNQKRLLDAALNNMRQGLLMFDRDQRAVVINRRYLDIFKLDPNQAKPGCTLRELMELRTANGTMKGDIDEYIETQVAAGHVADKTFDTDDGRTIRITDRPMDDGGWVSTFDDITERRRAEKERDRSQAFATTVIENVPATIIVKDVRDMRYVLVNRAGENYLGIPRDQIIGRTATEIFPSAVAKMVEESDVELLRDGKPQFFDEHPTETPAGDRRIVTTTRLSIRDAGGEPQYLLSVIEDRTNRKRAEAQIAHMEHHDSLTGLPNRSAYTACLENTIEAAATNDESFAVLSLDLDRFKEINDVFGHSVGDRVLREMSLRLQETIGGAFLARLGGDEFAVIATDGKQPAAAEALAARVLAAIGEEFSIDGQRLRSAMSIGIAVYPVDGGDVATLIANADAALYRAKNEGRGIYRFFEAGMDERLRERRVLQQDLQSAIERSELTLHYQPQAKIRGDVIGFEALARWRHPMRGAIPPGTFIPLAEESGLIIPMGEWILREACREAASWPSPLNISINLSPVQFRHGDLPALVHSVLLETGLAPSRLELEITEGVLIGDFSRAVSILRRLKTLGVRIAMDDFGTGYSSLSYLQSFPFDKIKIDQAFITNLESNPQSATIIRAVIGLARGLNLPVIAEGVETKEQLEFLATELCDEVQGYLIGRPRPIEDYAELTGQQKKARLGLAG